MADYARAVLEGVALELRRMVESSGGSKPEVVIVKGGGGASPLWCEIIGQVFDSSYRTSKRDAAYGASLVAAQALGWTDNYRAPWAATESTHEPDPIGSARMQDAYGFYARVTTALANTAPDVLERDGRNHDDH